MAAGVLHAQESVPAYKNHALGVEQRAGDLLGRMTAEEKAAFLAGSGWMESQPVPRLGIPAIKMADGHWACATGGGLPR